MRYSLLSLSFRNDSFINLNMVWICFEIIFSSISKGRCFGLGVGLVLGFGLVFVLGLGLVFLFSNSLLSSSTSRNNPFINLNIIWICFEIILSSISKGR